MSGSRVARTGCSHVPPRFEDVFLEDWDLTVGGYAATMATLVRQLVAGELAGVLLTGPVGAGKSHAAAIACNELASPLMAELSRLEFDDRIRGFEAPERIRQLERRIERVCPRWLGMPQLLAQLRREMGSEVRAGLDRLEDATSTRGLLVLDDVGSRSTPWATEVVSEIVMARYDDEAPVFITTNSSPQELADAGLERVVSRLADNGALVVIDNAVSDYRMRRRVAIA